MLYIKSNELQNLITRCKRNWWLFALSFCGCMTVAALFIFVKNKKFEVYTSINISNSSGGGSMIAQMAKGSGFGDFLGVGGSEVANEMVILESHHVLYNAVKASGYNVSYSSRPLIKRRNYWDDTPLLITAQAANYSDTLAEGLNWKVKIAADGKSADIYCKTTQHGVVYDKDDVTLPADIETGWGNFHLETTDYFKTGKSIKVMASWYSYTNVAQMLMNELGIGLVDKKADVVRLSFKDPIPNRCKALLNAIVESYEQYNIEAKNRSSQISMDFLQRRIDTVNSELAFLESKIESYKLAHKIGDVEMQAELTMERASELENEITRLEIIEGNVTELENYLNNPAHQYDPLPIATTGSEDASTAIIKYNEALAQYRELQRTTTTTNPTLVSTRNAIDASREALKLTISTAKRNAQSSLAKINHKNQKLLSMVNTIPTVEREFVELKREQELKQKIYVMLLAQQEQNALTLSMDQPKSQLVDEAYANVLPSGPKGIVIVVIALFFALFLPLAWLRFLDMISTTLRTPEQLKKLEGFTGDIHTLTDGNDEDLKQLCLELIAKAQQKEQRVVMLSMQEDEEQGALAVNIRKTLNTMPPAKHTIELVETPAFTQKSDVMYILPTADVSLLIVRQGKTLCQNLAYIETLIDKQLLKNQLTAYQL